MKENYSRLVHPILFSIIIPVYRTEKLLTSFDEGAQRTAFYAYTERYDLERTIETFFQETLLQKAKRKFRFFLRYAWYTLQGKGKPLY